MSQRFVAGAVVRMGGGSEVLDAWGWEWRHLLPSRLGSRLWAPFLTTTHIIPRVNMGLLPLGYFQTADSTASAIVMWERCSVPSVEGQPQVGNLRSALSKSRELDALSYPQRGRVSGYLPLSFMCRRPPNTGLYSWSLARIPAEWQNVLLQRRLLKLMVRVSGACNFYHLMVVRLRRSECLSPMGVDKISL